MKIAVFGTGGVGGYFGGRLAQAGAEVHLIARGSHLESLRHKGLRVQSVRGDFELSLPATADPAEIGPCDYVLFTVKALITRANQLGARRVVLHSSDMAVGVYRRVGFVERCRSPYLLRPHCGRKLIKAFDGSAESHTDLDVADKLDELI